MATEPDRLALLHADGESGWRLRESQFTGLTGTVTADGDANVKIDLISVQSGIDVRDVRMRFILFETYKFPEADISAKLDMNALRGVMNGLASSIR